METFLLDFFMYIPEQVLLVYGWLKVLPARNSVVFSVVMICVPGTMYLFGGIVLNQITSVIVFFVVSFLLPFFLFKGSVFVRAMVVILGSFCCFLAEAVGMVVLTVLTGSAAPEDYDEFNNYILTHQGEFALSLVVQGCALLILLYLLRLFVHRWPTVESTNTMKLFLIPPALQAAHFMFIGIVSVMHDTPIEDYLIAALLGVGCLVVDVVLISSIRRYLHTLNEQQKAQEMQVQLDQYLESSALLVREIERTAQARHDFRNQAQVALALAERGSFYLARDHVASMKDQLGALDARGGVAQ